MNAGAYYEAGCGKLMDRLDSGRLMGAEELAAYLGISRNASYTLLARKDFPSMRIGKLYYALRDEVDVWLQRQLEAGGYRPSDR